MFQEQIIWRLIIPANQSDLPKNTIGFGDYRRFDVHFQGDILGPAFALKFKIKDHEFIPDLELLETLLV